MNGTAGAAVLTAILLLWRVAVDYVPMFPLNDLARKNARSRKRDWTVHYIPLALATLLSLSPNRPAVAAGLLLLLLYAGVQAVMWWVPYWSEATEAQEDRWEQMYGRTHRLLPSRKGRLVPDTTHLVTGILTVLAVIVMAGHAFIGGAAKSASATAKEEPAAATPKPQAIETAFTQAGQKPEQLLIDLYGQAKTTLDIAVSAINQEDILKAILDARIRGVQVRVMTDRTESAGAAQTEKLRQLQEAGIPVKENSRKGLMDLKMSVVDSAIATTGSFNFTQNAVTANDEMLVVLRDAAVAKSWKDQFEVMWNDAQNFRDWKPGAAKK